MKSIAKSLIITSFAAAIAGLTVSCDSGPLESEADNIIKSPNFTLTDRGIDMAFAQANLADVAELPRFLLPGDTIQHTNVTHLDDREVSQLGNAVITSTGELFIDNLHLAWSRNEADVQQGSFSLSPINRWPGFDTVKRDRFRDEMDTLIAAAAGTSNSINSALGKAYNSQTPYVLTQAANSLGYLTAVGPETEVIDGQTVEIAYVLMEREVVYTVTSTYQDLIDFGTISGTFETRDRWGLPVLWAEVADGEVVTDASFDQVQLAHNPSPFVLFDEQDAGAGTFTIVLAP